MSARITVREIAEDLQLSTPTVYALLERKEIPSIRAGRIYIITRHAYEQWKQRCGLRMEVVQ